MKESKIVESPRRLETEIAGKAFAAGFKAALTKVKPEMRALEVMMVHQDQWSLYKQRISATGGNEPISATREERP
jgi:hypothetical protein